MDITTKAIALRATDIKEHDKYILLYSLEHGKISVHARGIRKPSAKLRFCADQFCFGNYQISKSADHNVLKTCEQLQSFYSLREDIVVYYSACAIAESLILCTQEEQSEPAVFLETLKAFSSLTDGVNPYLVVLRFCLSLLQVEGFALTLGRCTMCGQKAQPSYLDLQRGGCLCMDCRNVDSIPVSPAIVTMFGLLDGIAYEKLNNLKFSGEMIKEALHLLDKYISHTFGATNTFGELLKLD